jgi:hypothetical protein
MHILQPFDNIEFCIEVNGKKIGLIGHLCRDKPDHICLTDEVLSAHPYLPRHLPINPEKLIRRYRDGSTFTYGIYLEPLWTI